jgi:hypothetical protein
METKEFSRVTVRVSDAKTIRRHPYFKYDNHVALRHQNTNPEAGSTALQLSHSQES